jgi:hypothetical protein
MLVFSGADFEDFLEPRPDLPPSAELELEAVVRHLVENRWPFRLHATYDESIARFLDVFEKVNRDTPFVGLRWWFDHGETISPRSMERTIALGGGIAVQNRMAFQGEHFIARYGKDQAAHSPPIRRMRELGIPVGAGTDATRVASYNPWLALYWLVAGRTIGGAALYPEANRMSRDEALGLFTSGSAWFSGEQDEKGAIAVGKLADLAALSADYFAVPEEDIKSIESVLTMVDGKFVYGAGGFAPLAPPLPPVSPDWSPVASYGGYMQAAHASPHAEAAPGHASHARSHRRAHAHGFAGGAWLGGCDCFAF